jgi:cytochrome c oxidase subunit 3
MSEPTDDIRFPDRYPDATGKGDIHIPGAGSIGLVILLVSLSMLFLASILAYVVIRVHAPDRWPPPGLPHIPNSLWISTIVIVTASFTIQAAVAAVRRDDEKRLARWLLATFIIGVVFLALQTFNWIEFYLEIRQVGRLEGAYLGMFYVLTGLHAAHVVGGLIPLGIVYYRSRKSRYSRNFHPGVRYVSIYWHFLDIIWVVLFAIMYF